MLGPVFEWWNNLPANDPRPFTAGDLHVGRQNLRQTNGPVPRPFQVHTADLVNPGHLAVGRQNLRQTNGPVPSPFQVHTADLVNPGHLAVGRQNLAHTQIAHHVATVNWPGDDWRLTVPDPVVVALKKQTKGERLDELILLPPGVRSGRVRFYNVKNQESPGNTILGAGFYRVRYCYQTPTNQCSVTKETILHIKPTIDEVMIEMGFVSRAWRWDLSYGTHGELKKDFHLTVPKNLQKMPEHMDDTPALLEGLFPKGGELDGTHMSIECRISYGTTGHMNNAAYFLNGDEKYPQGFGKEEQIELVKACKTRLKRWEKERAQLLRDALKNL